MKAKAITLILLFFIFPSCATQRSVITPLQTVNFNYAPTTSSEAGSAGIGIILITPNFEKKTFSYYNHRPFTDFRKSLEGDLEEIITSRGFTFRGPFDGYDEITYSDKTQTDLVVEVEIHPSVQSLSPNPWVKHKKYNYSPVSGQAYWTYSYSYESTLSVTGKIKITFSEVLSHEKISIKNIDLGTVTCVTKSEGRYRSDAIIPVKDPGIFNPLVTALESVYKTALDKTWNQFDPEELKSWEEQIKELRERKKF
ncbi:MAG: hypothetical protein ACI9JN_002763 [Bacteroidia bacterium]|jgi:hypothetical protein